MTDNMSDRADTSVMKKAVKIMGYMGCKGYMGGQRSSSKPSPL